MSATACSIAADGIAVSIALSTVPDSTTGESSENSLSCIATQYTQLITLSLPGFTLNRTVLGDARHQNPGPEPKLDDVCCANLLQALRGVAPDGGLWNGRKVADYLSDLIGERISRQQGWEYLKQMRLRLRVPRPEHQEANPDEQETWKKTGDCGRASSERTSKRRRRGLV